jgi:serine/threonine-protein kinase RsbW
VDRPGLADVEIAFPPSPEFVGVVRHVVAALARLGGLEPEVVEDSKLAVSEACTNAVTMTVREGSEEPVLVEGRVEGDRMHLSILDRSTSPLNGERHERESTDSLDFSFERGLSLPLLESLVDEIEFRPRDGGGTEVRMALSGRGGEEA